MYTVRRSDCSTVSSREWFEYRALRFIYRAPGQAWLTCDWTGLVAARQRLIMTGFAEVLWNRHGYVVLTPKGIARYYELNERFTEGGK